MSKYDPNAAGKIAESILEQQNPSTEDAQSINEAKVTEFFEALHRLNIQVSSLTETQLRGYCYRLGLTDSQIMSVIDDWLSWAVTDDVSDMGDS